MSNKPAIPASRQAWLEQALLKMWMTRGPAAWMLRPLSWLMGCAVAIRRALYQWGVLRVTRVACPVLVVGNVVVGGAGKTPTTIAIVQHLQARGYRVGVVSRGYGRSTQDCVEVSDLSTVDQVGDEPALIQRTTQAPVFVHRTRHIAAQALLARYPQTHLIVCDDGLQHYPLYRDIEICVFDNRGNGNGWLLPAGPLRESWPPTPLTAIGQAPDRRLVLHTGTHAAFAGYRATRRLDNRVIFKNGNTQDLLQFTQHCARPLLALAGIARPESFFSMLRDEKVPLTHTLALPDHYNFQHLPLDLCAQYQLICTEKDARKLWEIAPDAVAVALHQTAEPDFFHALDRLVTRTLQRTH